MDDERLTAAEVMALAKISRSTLERWIRDKKLKPIRIEGFRDRRFSNSEVRKLLGLPEEE